MVGVVSGGSRQNAGSLTDHDGYLSLVELSGYSSLCVRSLRSHLRSRTRPLPHFRVGSKILIRKTDFDNWMKQFHVAVSASIDDVVDELCQHLTNTRR